MSDRATPASSTVETRAVSRNVERLNGLLELPSDPAEGHAAMLALTDDELVGFGLSTFRINPPVTDARTLRCYRKPREMAGAADRLSSEAGLDQEWLDGQAEASRSRIWSLMCQLAARDAIRSRPGRAGSNLECGYSPHRVSR